MEEEDPGQTSNLAILKSFESVKEGSEVCIYSQTPYQTLHCPKRWTKGKMLIIRLSRRSNFPHLDSAAPYILNHDAADIGAELDVAGQSGCQLRDCIFGRTKRGT